MNDQAAAKRAPLLHRRRRPSATTRVVLLWALLMLPLLWWGLPTTRDDDLLFGQQPPWKAARYDIESDLKRLRTRNAGADTDLNPLADRQRIIDLTADDAARAEILRRYRLYSRQPDEMITFRALQRMDPRHGDFDPQLYQYGGGHIYLIGAALAASSLLGIVQVTADAGLYLENPAAFARFYLVARFVSLVFGALMLVAVGKLAGRAGGRSTGWLALLCVALSPVFITAVLEAKPHLPSACLLLWAVLSALDYQAHGRLRDALRMGLQAGYAFGLVLTGLAGAALWVALLLAPAAAPRRRTLGHLALAGGLALTVYLLTNPYIPYNMLINRGALGSNLSNSIAMYQDQMRHAAAGAARVEELLREGAGAAIPLAGIIGLLLLLGRRPGPTLVGAAPGLAILLMGVLLGAGKPAEFARFLILPVLLLCVATAGLLTTLARRHLAVGIVATVIVLGLMHTPAYLRSFVRDARGNTESRHLAGCFLREQMRPKESVGLLQEPAPYAVPPLDFARRRVLLLPAARPPHLDEAGLPDWLVFTADDDRRHAGAWWRPYYEFEARFPAGSARLTPIAWADKPVFVFRRPASPTTTPAAGIPAR